jgi:hypothetical protein
MASRTRIPPPPVSSEDRSIWNNWYVAVKDAINNLRADLTWVNLNFTGSNITDIVNRSHQNLQNLQGGSSTERYHVSATQATAIAAFNATQWTDLTDSGESTLHYHAADRARANHTGTQLLATISDAGTAASQSGLSVVITTAPVTGGGATGSMTFTNGVLTAQTQAT